MRLNSLDKGLVAALLVMFGVSANGTADARELTSADVYPPGHPAAQAIGHLSALVEQRTEGRHRIVAQPGQRGSSEGYLIGQVRNGTLDMARIDFASLASLAPMANVLALPYIFKSPAHRQRVLDGEIGALMLAQLEPQGLVGLCFYESGARSFYGARPVRHPADLQGLTVRSPQSGPWIRMMRALGIRPLPMPYEHIYAGLQQGTIELAENNWQAFITSRHHEVAKYYSLTEHMMTPGVVIFSRRTWDTLGADDQAALRAAARDSANYLRDTLDEARPNQSMAPPGVEIVADVDRAAFVTTSAPLYRELAATPQLQGIVKRIQEME